MNTQFVNLEKREGWFHLLFWFTAMTSFFYAWSNNLDTTTMFFRGISTILTFILPIYINAFILIPQYFKKKTWLQYSLLLLVLLLMAKALHTIFLLTPWMIRDWSGIDLDHEFPKYFFREFGNLIKWIFSQTTWIVYLSFAYHFVKDRFVNEQVKSQLIAEKLSMELALLKTQVNPHFLFNTLNNIYAIALEEKAANTAENISKLGILMRYNLYDAQADFIFLSKELDYVERYIALQRMRLTDNQQLNLDISLEGHGKKNLSITPMILIPFIENAFKYGVSTTDESNISIEIKLSGSTLFLIVKNTVHKQRQSEEGGFGLENVKNRLELIYPNRHKLDYGLEDQVYKVDLELQLSK